MGAVGALWSFSPIKLGWRGLAWGSGVTEGLTVVPVKARALPVFSHFQSVFRKEICQHSWKKAGEHCWCPLEPSLEAFAGKPERCSREVCWGHRLSSPSSDPLPCIPQFLRGHPSFTTAQRGEPWLRNVCGAGVSCAKGGNTWNWGEALYPRLSASTGTRAAALPVPNTFLGRSQLGPTLHPDYHLVPLHVPMTLLRAFTGQG